MSLNVESLSNREKTLLFARLANTLTNCARDTYVPVESETTNE
jgi:hypothetical protein